MKEENCPIIACFALEYEAAPFRKALKQRPFIDNMIRVVVTGVGAEAAEETLSREITPKKTEFVVGSGFCGALIDEISVGQIVLDQKRSDKESLDFAMESLEGNARSEIFATSDEILIGEARQKFAKETKAAIIDMEGDGIVKVCKKAKIPYLGMRIVTDTPVHELPVPASVLKKAARSPLAMAGWLAWHPLAAPRVARFGQSADRCRNLLSSALLKLAFLYRASAV